MTELDFRTIGEWWTRRRKSEDKINIYFAAEAYLKAMSLVQYHRDEIGWNMVIKPYKDGYKVYDVVVYPQKASPGYIEVDVAKYGLWKDGLTVEQDANLFGHGHSHVSMAVGASAVDARQQYEEIHLKKNGFWLFQIWNKHGDINSFFYDIDNDLVYDDDKVNLVIEVGDEPIDNFINDSFSKLVHEKIGEEEDEPVEVF